MDEWSSLSSRCQTCRYFINFLLNQIDTRVAQYDSPWLMIFTYELFFFKKTPELVYSDSLASNISLYSPYRWYLPSPIYPSPRLYPSVTMPFTATQSVLGTPDFGLIHIDPEETAKSFQVYLETASKLTGVSLDDITVTVSTEPPSLDKVNLTWLLKHGMRLFDAIVWLTAGKPTSHPLRADPAMNVAEIPSMHDVARAVFYCYFMLVVQARYPVSKNNAEKPKIPNFLQTIMGMDADQHVYVERICSFEPQKFDPTWVKYVRFQGFGREVLSRFGLGVAGYRMFGPFALYKPKDNLSPEIKRAFEFAKKLATSEPTWDVHPLTRSPAVLTKRGNLNKNLTNLLLECFTDDQLKEMETAKVIYKYPSAEPTHKNYTQWNPEDDISGNSNIFAGL